MHTWHHPSKPEEIKPIPWLGAAVIERLEEIITKDFKIIEHGSGGSTLWLAARCKSILSVENNEAWKCAVCKSSPDNSVIISSIDFDLLKYGYDLMFIDGEPVEDRERWISIGPKFVKHGGYIVLDNANRPEYRTERTWLHYISKDVETFDCNDGTSYLVTDICRLP
jgi:hypothetical protein